jgi:hypothetical protein
MHVKCSNQVITAVATTLDGACEVRNVTEVGPYAAALGLAVLR